MSTLQSARPASRVVPPAPIGVERIVDCPFSLTLERVHLIFATLASRGSGARIPLREFGLPFGGFLTHRVVPRFERQPDLTEPGRAHDEVDFDWSAPTRWLPDFHGILRMRIERSQTRVMLTGDYRPPFGRLGALFDRLVGHRLARATAVDVLNRLASELEAAWTAEKSHG